jgi:serine phosphatase RsbU (regulator of sigma subunit)
MESTITKSLTSKENVFFKVARTFWSELDEMNEQSRLVGTGDVITVLYTLPFALIGLVWLFIASDTVVLFGEWALLTLFFALIVLFTQVNYFIIVEIRSDRYGSSDGSFASVILWTAIFIFGATAIWISVIWSLVNFLINLRVTTSKTERWNLLRNLVMDYAVNVFGILASINLYRSLGGLIPIPELTVRNISIAFLTLSFHLFITFLLWFGYTLYHIGVQRVLSRSRSIRPIVKFFSLSFGLPYLGQPFSILAAGLFVENGIEVFAFFILGLLLVAYLARQLSWAVESSRQQSRQLEKLEQLGRAIINSPPDASALPSILREHLINMFPSSRIEIWLNPDDVLYKNPSDWSSYPESRDWLLEQSEAYCFLAREMVPWEGSERNHDALVISPIWEVESSRSIGGILLELRSIAQPWDRQSLRSLFPAMQSLADQIASALHQSEIYAQTLAYQNITQELRLAGKIQASFLPNKFPSIPGWQLAMTLLPARETSGDFFDVIELADGRLGILIADVTDKGIGPALYMALSRTLIRTYAVEYDAEPEVVFFAANGRLMRDTRASLFVTAFYGILDPESGTLTYCNAGHNAPFLLKSNGSGEVQFLKITGMALGIEEDATWSQASVEIDPGDVVVFYTDGIPDAQNGDGSFFNEERLVETAESNMSKAADEIQTSIIDKVRGFTGTAPQSDDITLMVLVRNP